MKTLVVPVAWGAYPPECLEELFYKRRLEKVLHTLRFLVRHRLPTRESGRLGVQTGTGPRAATAKLRSLAA